MVSELMMEIEPVRVLDREECLPRVEDKVREPDSPCEKPLTSKADADIETANVLNKAEFFVMIADGPSEFVNILLRPLD